ncbi:MAG: phage minor head protein [Anaerobutyricum hallii]|uniref:phage minor head protein n=1 Tax=Anaerobutyricum hallii TaxID=39488 RepID=UPI0024305053|nr:phage minor head protein [Anaerobutyricum hallii]MDD6590000.1 phage minor head protein [Anaerobutyricum hallii]
MNKAQKEVLQVQLNDEQKTIKQLQRIYGQARKDCESKIRELSARTDLENLQSIIYQKQYQEALKKQLDGILDNLHSEEFTSVADYLQRSYDNGYIGVMYDLHKQGIPVIMPINQEQVVKALQVDSKLSNSLYDRLGEDVSYLKKSIRAELSRGIANGSTWNEMAKHIANGMNNPFNKSINNAIRISRTEGHRIQQRSALDAQYAAKEKGADVLKQWDSTLDNRTRPHHRRLDGQIRELDEPFEVDGMTAAAPGHFGRASEDCNCRCCVLQRARWALDQDELDTLKERAAFYGLDKSVDFAEFKQKYLHLPDNADTIDVKSGNWQGINFPQNYKTKKEAIKALSDKYGISFSDSRKYPIDETILCDAVSWMDAFEKEYPSFVKMNPAKLPKLVCKAPSSMKNTVGYFQYYYDGTPVEMALNGAYHSDLKAFAEYEKRCIESKWTVANATTRKTFVHEYGHYVSNSLRKINNRSWEHDFIQECVDEYKKSNPEYQRTTYVGLQKDCDEVSRYGMTSESECFAETFAEYYGGENPREFAQIFGRKLDKLLKGVK